MSTTQVKDAVREMLKVVIGMDNREVMTALAIATASIMKASFTPELHDALLKAFNENVHHALAQMAQAQKKRDG